MNQKKQASREKIIEAAKQLFHQQGYHSTTFSQLAELTSISKGNFYHHFKTKQQLLIAVVDSLVEESIEKIKLLEENVSEPKQRLVVFCQQTWEDREQLIRYGCPIATLNVELVKKGRNQAISLFNVYVDWCQKQLKILGIENPKEVSWQITSMLEGAILVASVYQEESFLFNEIQRIQNFILDLPNET